MRAIIFLLGFAVSAGGMFAAELLPIERQVGEAVTSAKPTVVHFWAPWCPNCYSEMTAKDGWSSFINTNPDVNFIFITTWNGGQGDGRALLAKNGIGAQKNFRLLLHPNGSRRDDEKMTSFLGLPVTSIPATWVFTKGRLRYALNYGEVRFPILQQLIRDATEEW